MWRRSAFISAGVRRRPARTLPWQASVPQTPSSRSFKRERVAQLGDLVGEVADQALHLGLAQQRRHLAHDDRARAERLEHQAELGQLFGTRGDAGPRGRRRARRPRGSGAPGARRRHAASAAFMRS